jgi:Mycothiol maleylpyruvate isomerase N-terminal domain
VDYVGHFLREVAAFEAAGHVAAGFEAAPVVPSCPGWVATDLVLHLGVVHRAVSRVIGERMQQPPERGDMPWLGLAEEWRGWLPPAHAPQRSPVPAGLLGWFHDGSADLPVFRARGPALRD